MIFTGTDVCFNACHYLPVPPALFVLLAMAIYTGVTVNFLGKRFGDWRFSWSYILGWVALLMTFFAGLLIKESSRCLPASNQRRVMSMWILHTVSANQEKKLIMKILKSSIQCCQGNIFFVEITSVLSATWPVLFLQVYSTCVPTGCTSAEEWLAHVKVNRR